MEQETIRLRLEGIALCRSIVELYGQMNETLRSMVEPPRVCRRLQLLRRWSDDKQDSEQVFA
jgi:hypothetical protein